MAVGEVGKVEGGGAGTIAGRPCRLVVRIHEAAAQKKETCFSPAGAAGKQCAALQKGGLGFRVDPRLDKTLCRQQLTSNRHPSSSTLTST